MAAIREPAVRRRGRAAGREYYFAERKGRRPWLQVVVHFEGEEGWVITAFTRGALPRR